MDKAKESCEARTAIHQLLDEVLDRNFCDLLVRRHQNEVFVEKTVKAKFRIK